MKLSIGYFYPDQLNLYGDNGNVEILKYRAEKRGIDVEVVNISRESEIDGIFMKHINLIFMGGGPDSSQKAVHSDLMRNKRSYLQDYIEDGGTGLFVCGSYQLLGKYYKASDGTILDGLGVFDLHTEHFGSSRPRCIGNVVGEFAEGFFEDSVLSSVNKVGRSLVGFENHGGRTYLGESAEPFAKILKGHGNNSEDGTEGIHYKNSIGTYFHGPVLSRNPHLADYLIAKAVETDKLEPLDDDLIIAAHTASKNLE